MTLDEKIALVHGLFPPMATGRTLPGWRIRGGRYVLAIARDAQDRTLLRTADITASTIKP